MKKLLLILAVLLAPIFSHADESLEKRILGTWEIKSIKCEDDKYLIKKDFDIISSKMILGEDSKIKEEHLYFQGPQQILHTAEGEFVIQEYKGLPSIDATLRDTVDGVTETDDRIMENHYIKISDDNKTLTFTQAQEEALATDTGPCPRNIPYIITWTRVR